MLFPNTVGPGFLRITHFSKIWELSQSLHPQYWNALTTSPNSSKITSEETGTFLSHSCIQEKKCHYPKTAPPKLFALARFGLEFGIEVVWLITARFVISCSLITNNLFEHFQNPFFVNNWSSLKPEIGNQKTQDPS